MRPPRGLTAEEEAAWARLAETVRPLNPRRHGDGSHPKSGGAVSPTPAPAEVQRSPRVPFHPRSEAGGPPRPVGEEKVGLDSHWERKLRGGRIEPDFTLDLHGLSLDAAHRLLDHGLSRARAMGARVVLVVTGKPRPVEAADRGQRRGAIRAKILDWLAAGPHAPDIAAIRTAQRRHGGEGALYIVLKRRHR